MTIFDFMAIANDSVLSRVEFVNFCEISTPIYILDFEEFSSYFFDPKELTGDEVIYFTVFNHCNNFTYVFFGEGGFENYYV